MEGPAASDQVSWELAVSVPNRQGQIVAMWAAGGGQGRGTCWPANHGTRGAKHHQDHGQLLLEENHSQYGGQTHSHPGWGARHASGGCKPQGRASLSTETSAKSHSPAPTFIKDVFVYMPHTISKDVGKEKCSLVGHLRPRK